MTIHSGAEELLKSPLALMPDYACGLIDSIYNAYTSGPFPNQNAVRRDQRVGAIAVIPVYGVISQRESVFSRLFGGTSTQTVARQLKSAASDPSVGTILIDIASPGGSVYGIHELADLIYKLRQTKKVTAIANSLAASAAYWIASAADEVVITPSGEAGSIGVVSMHENWSQFINATQSPKGLPKITFITAGKYKVERNSYEPLDQEALTFEQKRVNEYYAEFVKAVARNRGDSEFNVRTKYGQGRVVGARDAVRFNMADRIATYDETLSRLSTKKGQQTGQRGKAEFSRLREARTRLSLVLAE